MKKLFKTTLGILIIFMLLFFPGMVSDLFKINSMVSFTVCYLIYIGVWMFVINYKYNTSFKIISDKLEKDIYKLSEALKK